MQIIFILLAVGSICIAARGDIISTQILDTRNVVNNQAYIENELSQIVTDQFSIDPVEYGFWLYKVTYETIDIHAELPMRGIKQSLNVSVAAGVVGYELGRAYLYEKLKVNN